MPASPQTVRQIALTLPGVAEGQSYGTPSWHLGSRMLVRLREDGETLVVKVDFAERDRLLERFPEVFYLTDHYRKYQNVLVRLEAVSAETLRQVMEGAWRLLASKRHIAARDAAVSPAS